MDTFLGVSANIVISLAALAALVRLGEKVSLFNRYFLPAAGVYSLLLAGIHTWLARQILAGAFLGQAIVIFMALLWLTYAIACLGGGVNQYLTDDC